MPFRMTVRVYRGQRGIRRMDAMPLVAWDDGIGACRADGGVAAVSDAVDVMAWGGLRRIRVSYEGGPVMTGFRPGDGCLPAAALVRDVRSRRDAPDGTDGCRLGCLVGRVGCCPRAIHGWDDCSRSPGGCRCCPDGLCRGGCWLSTDGLHRYDEIVHRLRGQRVSRT